MNINEIEIVKVFYIYQYKLVGPLSILNEHLNFNIMTSKYHYVVSKRNRKL